MRRRDVLAAAGLAALARPAAAAAQAGDPPIMQDLIAAEEAAALAHRLAGVAPGVAAHEADHARALRTLLAAFGREAPPGPREAAALGGPAARLAAAGTPGAAIALESALIGNYRSALLELAEPSVVRTAASILAGHCQHRALLRAQAGRYPHG